MMRPFSAAKQSGNWSDLPFTSRMLGVDLDGSRRIEPAHVGCSSVQTAPDGCRRIVWMIIGMIKAIRQNIGWQGEQVSISTPGARYSM
jgi:hypothetical protein